MNALKKPESNALALPEADLLRVLQFDPTTGKFTWRVDRRGGAKAGDPAGTVKPGGYIQIHACGRLHYAHRLAWLFMHGTWPSGHVDHIDGNPSNNTPANLRDVSIATNQQNQRRAHRSNLSSGMQGVSFDARTGRWLAKISVSNRTKNLGRHDSQELAHQAYLTAKRQLHEGNTL
jgi:hypothetical protein